MKTDIRRYLAADSAARRLKLNTEAGTTQSSVQTAGPFRKIWQTKSGPSSNRRHHPADRTRRKIWVIQETEVVPINYHKAQPR